MSFNVLKKGKPKLNLMYLYKDWYRPEGPQIQIEPIFHEMKTEDKIEFLSKWIDDLEFMAFCYRIELKKEKQENYRVQNGFN